MITISAFGTTKDGRAVQQFQLTNQSGASVSVLNYGAMLHSVMVPDRNGILSDVLLGCDTMEDYEKQDCYFGATIGRYANRIGNSSFVLNGKIYQLEANDKTNTLHGGFCGFDKKIWEVSAEENEIVCRLTSPDGEGGFPGEMKVQITYGFDDENRLSITYHAECDQDTICNLTNHSYFNLAGKGNILSHILEIDADYYTEIDPLLLPTGVHPEVEGNPFDFRQGKEIGKQIREENQQLLLAGGYDHNFVLSHRKEYVAKAICMETGRIMTVATDRPGVQFYSGNFIKDISGKDGCVYQKNDGFCLETQLFPDSMAHPTFPSPILRKGESFDSCTVYHFGVIG